MPLARRLGVPEQQLEERDEVVGVPLPRRVRLAERRACPASRAAGRSARSRMWMRTGGPDPKRRSPVRQATDEAAALELAA